jgi:hypothetical protein
MKKLFQLVFGDVRNVVAVVLSVGLAWLVAQRAPAASGWVLFAAIVAAAVWQAT